MDLQSYVNGHQKVLEQRYSDREIFNKTGVLPKGWKETGKCTKDTGFVFLQSFGWLHDYEAHCYSSILKLGG